VRHALACTLVAGCFQPAAAVGVECSAAFECPGDQVCDRGGPVPICRDQLADAGPPEVRDAGLDAPIDATPLACPPTYVLARPGSTSRYRFVTTAASWTTAEADCEDDRTAPGAHTHLAVLADDAERVAVNGFAAVATIAWIGLGDAATEGTFLWVTEEPIPAYPPATGSPWAASNPTGSAFFNCVEMTAAGSLDDQFCLTTTHSYYCECDAFAADPARY
jgi:hypothetical protein